MPASNFSASTALATADWEGHPSPFDESFVQYAWDSTSLGLLKECPRKYFYKMIAGWDRTTKSHHLIFGQLLHTGLEIYDKVSTSLLADGIVSDDAHEEAVHAAIGHILRESISYQPGEKKGKEDKAKTRVNLIRVLVWYFEHYGKNDNNKVVILSNGKPAVELSFKVSIDNGLVICGHLDKLVTFGRDTYVQDHKSTSSTVTGSSARTFFRGFNPSNQMSLYPAGAYLAYNIPVRGVIIDAIQIGVNLTEFGRDITHRHMAQMDEFLESIYQWRKFAEICTETNNWPMNETSCGNYGGCEFRDICARSPQVRERFLKTWFVKGERWNPLRPR